MPVFDLIAFGRILIKYGFVIALILYTAGVASLLGDGIMSLWQIVSSSVDSLSNNLRGSGSGNSNAMSCAFYMMHALGIDIAISSFLLSVLGLVSAWAIFIAHLILIRFTYTIKNKLIESVK